MPEKSLRVATIVCAGLVAAALSAGAFEWPIEDGKFRFGFGSPRGGFLRGVEFGSSDGIARASDDGELIFAAIGDSLPGGYPLQGGSLVAIVHASDLTTIYAGLEPGSVSSYLKNVKKGDVLGRSPDAKAGRGASFYAYDSRERRYINPMILMPGLADDKPPSIRSVALSLNGVESPLDQATTVRQGSYSLLIDAHDASPAGVPSSPYDVRVIVDGSERSRVVYDAAWASAGTASLFGGSSVAEGTYLTGDGRIRFGPYSLSRGRVVITVAVSDFASNRREQTYSISVQ